MKAALRAAEQAGWRLVPAEPTEHMLDATSGVEDCPSSVYQHAVEAAPRPWEDDQ